MSDQGTTTDDDSDIRTVGIGILATLAVIGTLYVGRQFFVPIAFGFLLDAVFRPVAQWLNRRLRIPPWAGAALIVLALIGLIILGGYALSGPVKDFLARAPERFEAAEKKLAKLREPVAQLSRVTQRIERAAGLSGGAPSGATSQPATQPASRPAEVESHRVNEEASPPPPPPQAPAPVGPSIAGRFLGTTTSVVGGITEGLVLLYLLLAADDLFFRKLLKVMPTVRDKKVAREVLDEAQSVVMRYLWVTLLINLCQGTIVALVLWWLKMPGALMWGLLTVALEFIPYLGAAAMIVLLAVVAFASFDSFGHVLAAPGSYLLITTLQNNIASPIAYGDRLKLNAVAVLIGVIFWWYVWGIPGAFLSVPIIATIKIIACRTERFTAVGEFLSE